MRSSSNGPRSLTRTKAVLRFLRLVTRSQVPMGSVGWAQVIWFMSNRSPAAVVRPLKCEPYQEANPTWSQRWDRARVAGFWLGLIFVLGDWSFVGEPSLADRKSTRLNSSHLGISYA